MDSRSKIKVAEVPPELWSMQLCQSSGLFSRKLRPSHLSRPQIVVRLVGRPLSQNPAQNLLAGGQVRQLFGDMVGRLSVLPPGYSLHMAPDTEGVSVCKPAEERHIVGCSWDGGVQQRLAYNS